MASATDILDFWFTELTPAHWFRKDSALDQLIRDRFLDSHHRAAAGECFAWRASPEGQLAEILVLDQFSRNMFRDDSRAFAQDVLALVLAQEAVRSGADQSLSPTERAFLYMPYMHSESAAIHVEAVRLFDQPGLKGNLEFEHRHKAIIDRFGRYPHRNAVLGRDSTAEEREFLKQPGSGF